MYGNSQILSDFFLPVSTPQEVKDVQEFYLSLEKDPQQEEFLQGRMQGNPYPSSTAGLGPLMRDVKNKICTGQ